MSWVERLRVLREQRINPPPEPPIDPKSGNPLVAFQGPWSRPEVGWDIAIRAWARALSMAGADVRLMPMGRLSPMVEREVGKLAKRWRTFDVKVVSGSFPTAKILGRLINSIALRKEPHVFHTMFERSRFDPAIAGPLSRLRGVWVPCTANRLALEAIGLKNVHVFGVPWFEDDPVLALPTPVKPRTFYWIGSWAPHKQPDNLIRAFMAAFRPAEAALLIKRQYVHRSMPTPEKVAEESFGKNGWTKENWQADITIESRTLSYEDLVKYVHGRGEIYVSASRGEGFDLPAFAAKLARRRVVTANSGGPLDFLGSEDIVIPQTGTVTVHADYVVHGWERDAEVNDYRIDDLSAAMLRARGAPVLSDDWDKDAFSARAIGTRLRDWLLGVSVRA